MDVLATSTHDKTSRFADRLDADDRPLASEVPFAGEPLGLEEFILGVIMARNLPRAGRFSAGEPDGPCGSPRNFFLRAMGGGVQGIPGHWDNGTEVVFGTKSLERHEWARPCPHG